MLTKKLLAAPERAERVSENDESERFLIDTPTEAFSMAPNSTPEIGTSQDADNSNDGALADVVAMTADEQTPRLSETGSMTRSQAWNLYTSHFLSTWNIRTYEYSAVSIFPALPNEKSITELTDADPVHCFCIS